MATSWEAYKKKRKQSDKSSSASWNSYAASREAEKLTRNDISPLAKVVKEDIAPVKEETKERKWFETGAFADGYQFGDITKTILGTTTDVQQDLTKGILKIGEGLVDTVAYGVGGIADLIGQDDFANKTKEFIKKDYVEDSKIANRMTNNSKTGMLNNLLNGDYQSLNPFNTEKLDDDTNIESNSVFGDKTDSLVQSGGQLAGTIGLQAIGVPWWVTTGTTSFGSGTQEAFQDDASYGEAGAYGLISAGAEVLTEKLSGGISFGGKTLDDVLLKPLTEKITNKTLSTLTKFGLDAVGEGTEEVLTEIIQNVGKKLTYEDEKTWSELLTSEEAMDQYLESFIGGAVLGGGASAVTSIQERSNNKVDNTAQVEGLQQAIEAKQQELSQTQDIRKQQIIQEELNVLQEELNEATNAQNFTNETVEEDAYYLADKQVKQKYSKPVEISKLDIVEQNGGGKRDIQYWLDKIKQDGGVTDPIEVAITDNGKYKIYDGHHRLQAAQELGLKEIPVAFIKEGHYTNAPAEFLADAQQTTNEADLSKQSFVYQAQETDSDIKKSVYESASKYFNDTKASHSFVDTVAKIAEGRGTKYEFVNTKAIKEAGYNVENVSVNGLVTEDGRVLLNIDSKQGLDFIVGHETTHLLEGTKEYQALQDTVIEYAKQKGIYDDRIAKLHSLYQGKGDINAELTSDLVGELLFTDSAFVESLSVKQPTLFEKIKNFISDLVVKFKGTEQEKQLRQLQRSFEKAYKAQSTQTSESAKYSFVGQEITSRNPQAQEALNKAKELHEAHADMDYIRQNTGWFKATDGHWKAEIDDSNAKLTKKLEKNKTYKLGDILQHDNLYSFIPEYKNIEVVTTDMKANGSFNHKTGVIKLNNNNLNNAEQIKSTLLHEIQHATQSVEGFERGTNLKKAESYEAYKNNLGEKEAREVQTRRNMSFEDRMQIAPSIQTKTRYSLTDNQGRTLTKEQQEYFKDSKARDENGNLEVVYHSTPNNFTVFDKNMNGKNTGYNNTGFGTFVTTNRTFSERFKDINNTGTQGTTMKLYANVTNPIVHPYQAELKYGTKKANQIVENYFNAIGDTKALNVMKEYIRDGEAQDLYDAYMGIALSDTNAIFENASNERLKLEEAGYDAVEIVEGTEYELVDGSQTNDVVFSYAIFNSNQLKNVDNTKPTSNPDINLSLSAKDDTAPIGNVFGKDLKVQVEEAITPLQEKIESLTEQLDTVVNSLEQLQAPTSQDIVEKQSQEAFDTITDEHAPSFEDTVEDAMWNEEFESTSTESIPSPFDTRDIDEVGNRKVKAYQYENPEVRPYFQQEAQNMMWDLNNTIKGERSFNDQLYYDSNGEQGFFGTTRQTTEAIAYLKDKYGYSYAQIEKGLNDIIEDNGKENNAVAKRIEFMLDERLREGYTTSDGIPIPPNEEYIKFLEEKQITEYNREISSTLTDADAPIEETIEAPIEKTPVEVSPEPSESLVIDENVKGQLSVPLPETTAQNRNTELADTSTETQEQEKVAQILSERPTQENKKQRIWAKARAAFIDKGSVFEDLSLKTKNRELMAKWNDTLSSEAVAQDVLLNGTKEIDALSNTNKQVSKSLYDIRTEVGDKVQEFSEYLYHKHNVDRMSIESNAQARMAELQETTLKGYDLEQIEALSRKRIPNNADKVSEQLQFKDVAKQAEVEINAAKEFMRLTEAKNKPVFGNSVTAEISQQKVNEYEMNNPEFMDWANDVYDYNKANLNQLVKSGVISQETADQFAKIYPNYVPIGRADVKGSAINVPLDTNRTGINAPIARATGGNSDILPLFDTMEKRTLQTYRAIAKNDFGVELKNTLNSTIENQQSNVDEILDNVDQQENLLQEGKNGKAPTFTVFENGEKVTYEITEDMYDALKPVSEGLKGNILWGIPNKISSFHRGVLTEYNPVFMLTNSIKDAQDILLNSQHATKTYSKMPEAYAQILKKGLWYQEYMASGGQQNSYFDTQEDTIQTERKGISKVLDLPPLKQISQLNNIIELAPRLAEYIASRELGRSKKVSMLDAARVTTNFKAGGDITKWANRNGATFLNASIQGAMQQVRNVREAHANGLKGYANLASKFALAGVPAMILNAMLWGDDEEYEELSDYVKQSYWIVGKYGDGNFIRIPKGRMITVVQEALNQMTNLVTGNDEADLSQFLEIVGNNIAPNNPIENNVLAPFIQAATNKTWYGGDLVPTRLQDVPAEEQYDESIDKLSIAIGQATGISPYKINYVLDQYTGGVGDVFLPMMTQQAEGGKDDLLSNLIAPLTNKFTVDSTMKNQSVSDLYDLSEELTVKANSSKATDEDILKNKYVNSVKSEMNELYKEKREIQNSDLSDSEKYNQVREIQDQINTMAKEATTNYENVTKKNNYATVGNKEYYLKNDTWTKVNNDELTDLNNLGMNITDKGTYFNLKSEISEIKDSTTENKKAAIATTIRDTDFTDEQKAYVYGKNYSSDETLDMVLNTGMSFNEYLNYASQEFVADKDSDGKSISGSRKTKVINYINSLNLNIPQKAMLIRKEYSTFDDYNEDIIRYVVDLDLTYDEKKSILESVDMKVSADGTISW